MDQEQAFLQAMVENPRDLALRLIFADWLEEHGDPRGELLRLTHLLTQDTDQPNRRQMEERLRSLLAAGVQPVGPFCTNVLGMRFAWVPPGVFLMGSPGSEWDRKFNESQHRVRLTKGLWLGVHPVTQAQWQAIMGNMPSSFRGDDLPVERVPWDESQGFCARLSQRDGRKYTLPTEAEWEYACRAGTTTPFHFGEVLDGTQANCDATDPYGTRHVGPYLGRTTAVGSYRPNAFGLWDMHGNVWEWCRDYYTESPYLPPQAEDPINLTRPDYGRRVLRGGSWYNYARFCRSAFRFWYWPGHRGDSVGCRVCFRLD
jgi:uncharacterized protein (TIGR02996 family)